jgi:hypothetical protein
MHHDGRELTLAHGFTLLARFQFHTAHAFDRPTLSLPAANWWRLQIRLLAHFQRSRVYQQMLPQFHSHLRN